MNENTLVTVETKNSLPEIISEEKKSTTIISIKWDKNYNKKMCCDAFIHIDLKGERKPTYKQLESMAFNIATKDASHEPVVAELYDLLIFPLKQLTDTIALASHGMTATELCDFLFIKHPHVLTFDAEICCYLYKKIKKPIIS